MKTALLILAALAAGLLPPVCPPPGLPGPEVPAFLILDLCNAGGQFMPAGAENPALCEERTELLNEGFSSLSEERPFLRFAVTARDTAHPPETYL